MAGEFDAVANGPIPVDARAATVEVEFAMVPVVACRRDERSWHPPPAVR
jgi:hypothetical protein